MIKQEQHIFTGLQRDIDPAKQKAEYLSDAYNIRFTSRGSNTLLAITNERGPKQSVASDNTDISLEGTCIGHCVLNNYVIVFTTSTTDRIYRIKKDTTLEVTLLYSGSLNFNVNNPIETLGVIESDFIQKVYWVDGLNQPRVINIVKDLLDNKGYTGDNPFDFVQNMQLNETVNVIKEVNNSGIFPAGCIQYAITYYNKYGQETNIAYTTSLFYTSFPDRGGSPDSKCSNAFRINILNADTNFDYVRIYSIFRTSYEAAPTAKRLVDIQITADNAANGINYLDKGDTGDDIDPKELLYIGGETLVASTLAAKDGTLFLGNIKISRSPVSTLQVGEGTVKSLLNNSSFVGTDSFRTAILPVLGNGTYYYQPSFNGRTALAEDSPSVNTLGFKYKEYYRFGVQFQHKSGKWSEPIWLNDAQIGYSPGMGFEESSTNNKIMIPTKKFNIPANIVTAVTAAGYKRARGLVVFPTLQDRTIITQGMMCPTVYSITSRNLGFPYAQSSWFLRPFPATNNSASFREITSSTNNVPFTISLNLRNEINSAKLTGAVPECRHLHTLQGFKCRGSEIQGIPVELSGRVDSNIPDTSYILEGKDSGNLNTFTTVTRKHMVSVFAVDQSIVTMHSPEIEFDDSLASLDYSGASFRLTGSIIFISNVGDISIETSTPTVGPNSSGFINKTMVSSYYEADRSLLSGLFYGDYIVDDVGTTNTFGAYDKEKYEFRYMIYPWQRSGSLNNDIIRGTDNGTRTAILKRKVISNLKYSDNTEYNDFGSFEISTPQLFNSDEVSVVRLPGTNIADGKSNYYGNIDTLLPSASPYGVIFSAGNNVSALDWNTDGTTKIQYTATFEDSTLWHGSKNGLYYNCYNLTASGYFGWNDTANTEIGDWSGRLRTSKEGIRMKYRSTPHLVFKLANTNLEAVQPNATGSTYLYMGELYRPYDVNSIFGGQTEDAFKNNKWIPAGDPVTLVSGNICTIKYSYGDTWFQRYDCLKTYPFSKEDENSIVEIGSFLVETRINIDGRYDRNRGQTSNINITPENFNKINPVYSQLDNFFSYRILDSDYYKLNDYPSSIIWSLQKTASSEVDSWTSVTTNSLLDLDGNKGKVTKLLVNSDNIYCFQDYGISNILFNSRVQMPTSDGIPIEITNNYKVDGYRYITEAIGCTNKWAMTTTPSGIYFIDSISKAFYNLNGTQLGNISNTHGMNTWFSSIDSTIPWTASSLFNGVKCFYDNINNDIYIITNTTSLCFSEILGQFTSFMAYEKASAMFNIGNSFYILHPYSSNVNLFEMFKGKYNNFFGSVLSFGIKFVSNSESNIAKTFTNVDLRADFTVDMSVPPFSIPTFRSDICFDTIRVYSTCFDTTATTLNYTNAKPSGIKNKFRTWRIIIPRDYNSKLKRINDNYAHIQLKYNNHDILNNNARMILHDVGVTYFTR